MKWVTILALSVLAALVDPRLASAGDLVVPFPPQLERAKAICAARGEAVAVALQQESPPDGAPYENQVTQFRGAGAPVLTRIGGWVNRLQYDEQAERLLVEYHVGNYGSRVALVDREGNVLWDRQADGMNYWFSTDGSSVLAWDGTRWIQSPVFHSLDSDTGKHVIDWRVGERRRHLRGVALIGSGNRALVAAGQTLMLLRHPAEGGPPVVEWRHDLTGPEDQEVSSVAVVNSGTIVVYERGTGTTTFVSSRGAILFQILPEAMAAANPDVSRWQYASLRAFRGTTSRNILLLDKVSLLLDLEAGSMQRIVLNNLEPPAGYEECWVGEGKLLFVGKHDYRVRELERPTEGAP